MRAVEVDRKAAGRILVVDDEPAMLRILSKLLGREGYEVLQASSATEALQIVEREDIDTVILDVMMPEVDGVELCRRIRAHPVRGRAPIVFVSAADDVYHRRKAREAGADDFITKPIDEAELRARIRSSVASKRHHDELHRDRVQAEATAQEHLNALQDATETLERVRDELEAARVDTIERLTRAAEFRDDETAAHLQRMSHYCRLLARKRGLGDYTAELLRLASPMHDLGKIGIPDSILLKPGKLTTEEFTIMKQHAEIGYRILSGSDSELLVLAANIARSHHEKWNGSGYPQGLQQEDIPIEGRIAAVADVFDALTSKRPYKPAWPLEDAIALLENGKGAHFDPALVELFLGSMDEVLEIKNRFRDEPVEGSAR